MQQKQSNGNLIIAIAMAIIVGVVVFFLIDSRPVEAPTNTTVMSGESVDSGLVAPETTTGQ